MAQIRNPLARQTELYKILHSVESEEEIYESYFQEDLWSVEQFVALIAGLTPEEAEKIMLDPKIQVSPKTYRKIKMSNKIFSKFNECHTASSVKNLYFLEEKIYMSPFRWIKWTAENSISMTKRFFKHLSLNLMEAYIEFQPINQALRTAHKNSRDYHHAFYIKHAESIIEKSPNISSKELYQNPHMESVRRMIREWGGNYKKRTYKESWQRPLFNNKKGRPKKNSAT